VTFKQLQDATLADAFAEAKRSNAKDWLNFRLTWIFDSADWTFTKTTSPVTVTANSQVVTAMPADFAVATGLWNAEGVPLDPIQDYADFASLYVGTSNVTSGKPEAYTVVGTSVFVGPTSSETSAAYLLAYERAPTLLVNDGDVPNIPAGYHMALVHGAKAEGFKLSNVPMAGAFEEDFQAAITVMGHKYLVNNRAGHQQVPAYRP
jgi:hypothetical protein